MSPASRAYWKRANGRVSTLQPDVQRAILRAFAAIAESLSEADMAALIRSGALDRLVSAMVDPVALDRAVAPVRQRMRTTAERGFKFATADLPKGGKIDGQLAVSFDWLNPRVIDAIRTMESRTIDTLKADVRDVVRAHVENGLRDGKAPKVIARSLREAIGLAPNQERAVQNFERMLRGNDPEALTRVLRDRRFDGTIRKALAGEGLSEAQVTTMTSAYRRRFVAYQSEINAKAATFDSYRVGQRLAWESAVDAGVIPEGQVLMKMWIHLSGQKDPRPEHEAMNGVTVPFDEPYSSSTERENDYGMSAGEFEYNCRCMDRVFVSRVG